VTEDAWHFVQSHVDASVCVLLLYSEQREENR